LENCLNAEVFSYEAKGDAFIWPLHLTKQSGFRFAPFGENPFWVAFSKCLSDLEI